jgi:tRNA dimethylallyltransferase
MAQTKTLIVIAGPTAIGKTDLAIKIAQHYQTEIISADSRQFYREMHIGTAKPSSEELSAAKHHFIDSHSITEPFTVGDFEEQALALINQLFEKYDKLVVVGGSGLFIKAITDGFDKLPKAPPELREELNQLFAKKGIQELQQMLQEVDPQYAVEVDLNNPQRLIRALEVCISTGQPFSSFRTQQTQQRDFQIIKIALTMERAKLYERINRRVDLMLNAGLLDEVKSLIPYRHYNALNTVGYSELFEHLDGTILFQEAIEAIKQNTRRFAKRQLTWFRREDNVNWFEPDQSAQIIEYIDKSTV